MFIEERHREILKRLNASGTITTAEIQRLFGIGYDSAKRDLRILEEKGLLKRTHGGAISLSAPERKETLRIVKDERPDIVSIARYAVSLIKPDEVIFLPASPVGLQMVRGLPDGLSVRVVTNSLALAEEARQRQGTKVFMIGGELDDRGCATDSFATETIRRIRMELHNDGGRLGWLRALGAEECERGVLERGDRLVVDAYRALSVRAFRC